MSISQVPTHSPFQAPALRQHATLLRPQTSGRCRQKASKTRASVSSLSDTPQQAATGRIEATSSSSQSLGEKLASASRSSVAESAKATASKAAETGASGTSSARGLDGLSSSISLSPAPNAAEQASSTPTLNSALNKASEAVSNATSPGGPQASGSDTGLLDSLSSSVTDATQSLLDKAAEAQVSAAQSLQGASGDLKDQLDAASDLASDALKQTATQLGSAKDAATDVVISLSDQLSQSTASALSSLPAPFRDVIYAAAAQASKALEDPRISKLTAGAAVAVPTVLLLSGRFGGYAGLLKAEKALEVLQKENSVLIDVRSDDKRLSYGTPDLRFGARSRGVALPLVSISRRSGTQVVKADVLPLRLAAIVINGLSKVNRRTKIIILDDSEKRAIKLARAISSETSLKAYALEGGFSSWVASGLPVKDSVEYDDSALDSLTDTFQGRVLPVLRNPVLGIGSITLSVLAVAAVYDVHRTLQFIGTYGVLATVGTAPVRYSSKEEAYEQLIGPFAKVAGFVGRLLPKSTPGSVATPVEAELTDEDGNFEDQQPLEEVSAESEKKSEAETVNSNA